MSMTIEVHDLCMFILWAAAVVLIVYLVLLIKRALDFLKTVNQVVQNNEEKFTESLNELPSILQNVDDITGELSHDVKAVRSTVDSITEKSIVAADSLENIDSVIAGVTTVIQSGMFLKDLYDKNFKYIKKK